MPPLDKSKLVQKKEIVTRADGTTYTTTKWVKADKDVKKQKYSKKYANKTEVKPKKYTGTVRLDHPDFKRGDKVEITVGGKQVEAEFRHIVVDKKNPKGIAHLRVEIDGVKKTVGRNVEAIKPLTPTPKTGGESFVRRSQQKDFAIGDEVTFSVRVYDVETGKTGTQEVRGIVSRFKETDSKGTVVHITLEDGTVKGRYLHNITRYTPEKAATTLTDEQETAINKAVNRIVARNDDDVKLIQLFKRKKGSEEKVIEITRQIDIRNHQLATYLEVLKGKMPFEDLHEFAEPIKVTAPEEPKQEEQIVAVEDDTATIEQARLKGLLDAKEDSVLTSKRNMKRYKNSTEYLDQLQYYRSQKGYLRNMDELIQFKNENSLELNEQEQDFLANRPKDPIKPVKPVEEVEAKVEESTPLVRTKTTIGKTVKKREKLADKQSKIDELKDLIDKTEKMGLKDETKEAIVNRYKEKLSKLENKKDTDRVSKKHTEKSILEDIEKISRGQDVKQFSINQRIMESPIAEEVKARLRQAFSTAIKTGIALRNQAVKDAKRELRRTTNEDVLDDFEKAVLVSDVTFGSMKYKKVWEDKENVYMLESIYKSIKTDIQLQVTPKILKDSEGELLHIVVVKKP